MKQSNGKTHFEETAALLVRISRDDGEDGDSNSIQNQIKLLNKIASDDGYTDIVVYKDDGITGTTMKRPGFQEMIKDIKRGRVHAVYVKDLSRLGRNYREVGYYTFRPAPGSSGGNGFPPHRGFRTVCPWVAVSRQTEENRKRIRCIRHSNLVAGI